MRLLLVKKLHDYFGKTKINEGNGSPTHSTIRNIVRYSIITLNEKSDVRINPMINATYYSCLVYLYSLWIQRLNNFC